MHGIATFSLPVSVFHVVEIKLNRQIENFPFVIDSELTYHYCLSLWGGSNKHINIVCSAILIDGKKLMIKVFFHV